LGAIQDQADQNHSELFPKMGCCCGKNSTRPITPKPPTPVVEEKPKTPPPTAPSPKPILKKIEVQAPTPVQVPVDPNRMTLEQLKELMKSATKSNSIKEVENALNEYEKADKEKYLNLDQETHNLAEQLRKHLKYLNEIDKLKKKIHKINRQSMAEIQAYTTPPEEVYKVIKALVILLGGEIEKFEDWRAVKNDFGQIGRNNIKYRIQRFGPSDLTRERVELAEGILEGLDDEQVDSVSNVLGMFYAFAKVHSKFGGGGE